MPSGSDQLERFRFNECFRLIQIGDEVQQPFPLRMMSYSAIHAGNLIRARTLIIESLKGNRSQGHITGQLACLIAWATCEQLEDRIEKAMTLAASVNHQLLTSSHTLLESDSLALEQLLQLGRATLSQKQLKQAVSRGQMETLEQIVAQEFPILL